ncbi:MAG: diacylglycerol O-acyltransferase / wax synthase [Thermoleophilaceae bacterium]|jgi:WS/DGAT/MGAT family acyltransferase|nr:diacylglycerol O-acyltransferase / wax synthase [Thermoleophilaceae bacterium]
MARLSTLDASFLRVETETAHMHVGWMSTLALPPGDQRLDADALRERIAARLHLAPRFRQRVVQAPLAIGEPYWQDDPDFDVARHVRTVGGRLRETADDFFSKPLPRDRPLWEIAVLPSTGPDRAAVLGKIHHAMVDGVAAVELGMLLFDLAPDGPPPDAVDWAPIPAGGPLRLTLDSVGDAALDQFRAARRVAALGLSPARSLRIADSVRRAAFSLAEDVVNPAPESYLNAPIGPGRTLVPHAVALGRLLRLKERSSVTLNDVVLATVSGALRRLALSVGEEPEDLRVMIPVNVRGADDAESQGNRITFAFVELPVREGNAARRLATIRERTLELKESGRVAGSDMLLRSLEALPAPLKTPAARLAASPRLYNLTISNVPGPRVPLYVAGARVRSVNPVIPIPDRHALSIGVLTYGDYAHFAAYADPAALPEVRRLPVMLDDAVRELELVLSARKASARPSTRRSNVASPSRARLS